MIEKTCLETFANGASTLSADPVTEVWVQIMSRNEMYTIFFPFRVARTTADQGGVKLVQARDTAKNPGKRKHRVEQKETGF